MGVNKINSRLQIMICHNSLVTNSILKKMGINNTDLCNFCTNEKDTIAHYLWDCQFSQRFWRDFQNIVREKCENCTRLVLNVELVLFGNSENTKTDEIFNQIMLWAKYFVYKCRIDKIKPALPIFLKYLKTKYEEDKYIHCVEMSYLEFNRKWYPYKKLVATEMR